MKLLGILILVLPGIAIASGRLDFGDSMFASLGQAVSEDGSTIPNLCVQGNENLSTLTEPKVIYRLRSEIEGGSAKLFAEMIVLKSTSSVSTLKPALGQKIAADHFSDVCGVGYISKIDFGSRLAFGKFLTIAQAKDIPSLELVEFGGVSRAQEFEKLVIQLTQNLPANLQNWPFKDAKGPIIPQTSPSMAVNFEEFKSATNQITELPPVQGELVSYPAPLWKALIK